jgi:hypothetical protein
MDDKRDMDDKPLIFEDQPLEELEAASEPAK